METDNNYKILFEKVKIGPKTLKNRFYQVPQCTGAGTDKPGANAKHREIKAEGEWAALNTEACIIDPNSDQSLYPVANIWDKGDLLNLKHMVESIHKWNALAGIELVHSGGLSDTLGSRHIQLGLHQYPRPGFPQFYTHEATTEDIENIINQHVIAAVKARDIGFDIVYVHGTHGALPVQALSKYHNRRTDKYGGSFQNRARLWEETLEKIKEKIGDTVAICTRISIDMLSGPNGVELFDEGLKFIELLSTKGIVDFIDVNISSLDEWGEDAGPSRFYKTNHQKPWIKEVKKITTLPVVGVGRFTDPHTMVQVIKSKQLDIIGCARPSIADPWLPRKIKENRIQDICECIGCNACISRFEMGSQIVCTQNPTTLEEYRRGWHPEKFFIPKKTCHVLIIGAGPAGLECARILGKKGYKIDLVEKSKNIGGHLLSITKLPGLSEWIKVIDFRKSQLNNLSNVNIILGAGEVTEQDLLEYETDKIILATGSFWQGNGKSPFNFNPIPGIDHQKNEFITPEQLFNGKNVGKNICIIDSDGYFMATSIAEQLVDSRKKITIINPFNTLSPYSDFTLEGPNLRRMAYKKNIYVINNHWVESCLIKNNKVSINIYYNYRDDYERTTNPMNNISPRKSSSEIKTLNFDNIILCTSRSSNDLLYKNLKNKLLESDDKKFLKNVFQIGDCYAPRLLPDTIFDAHRLAREFESDNPQIPLPYIRERQIWGQKVYPELN